jgi:hypothetical protein
VGYVGARRGAYGDVMGKSVGKRDGRIKLKLTFWSLDWKQGSGQKQVMGSYEYGNRLPVSIKCGEFLNYLRIC